jgi:hypothetical protein
MEQAKYRYIKREINVFIYKIFSNFGLSVDLIYLISDFTF